MVVDPLGQAEPDFLSLVGRQTFGIDKYPRVQADRFTIENNGAFTLLVDLA